MSYNITMLKILEIDSFIIPLSALTPENSDWSPVIEMRDHNRLISLTFAEGSRIQGENLRGEFLQVTGLDCSGECSGACWEEVFEPAFKGSTGKLVAVAVWAGGDSIQTLTVDGGKVTWAPYEFCIEKASEPPWFLLYGGSSDDGGGPGRYETRTTDIEVAREHFRKVKESPYNTGYIKIVTDNGVKVWKSAFDKLEL